MLTWALAVLQFSAFAVTSVPPGGDDEVLEVLPAITRARATRLPSTPQPANPAASALRARQDIEIARQTGDTRYWGRAQAELSPWWDRPDAPIDLAVLQATVQQGRHQFEDSRKVLTAALARVPHHAQGWLNLAALERLSGQYVLALAACDAVAKAGQALYALACRLETQSLQGRPKASRELRALLAQTKDNGQRSWLLSLLAEMQERAGQDVPAAESYKQSLALAHDLYTAIAYSDLLLRTGKTRQALQLLTPLPETDAVLLRRATALRRLGDARWSELRAELRARAAELERRGDDPNLHGRETALAALWLDDAPRVALQAAQRNLVLQREPIDWWVGLQSARLSKDSAAEARITKAIHNVGLMDVRLTAAHAPGKP